MDELRPAKRNVEVEVEVKAVDRFRYDASKSKGYVRLTATVLTNREAVHRKASGPHLTVHASFLSGTHGAMVLAASSAEQPHLPLLLFADLNDFAFVQLHYCIVEPKCFIRLGSY